ncbi:hypothetical protein Ahy_A06g028923 [Arachis hypogaea]|uniref:Aspartic peptidase DDI1-type domain-containing protein n=1 Tax=Arachis hypogaea TaxID=3818 RepID=A0A445CS66_ARAHY|nr:hypothetical protein Ahy_A06g028923 [Arachis hypogaea]
MAYQAKCPAIVLKQLFLYSWLRLRGLSDLESLGLIELEAELDEGYFEEGDDEMVGTMSIIPTEPLGEYEGNPEKDYDMDVEETFSFIRYEDEPGYFLRPLEKQKSHLRPLYITTTLSGIKVNKVLIDGGVAISLLPERMLMKVGKHPNDLVPTNIAFSHGLSFSSLCNANDMVSRTTDLIAEVHCVENKANKQPNLLIPDQGKFEVQLVWEDWRFFVEKEGFLELEIENPNQEQWSQRLERESQNQGPLEIQ